MPSLPILEGPFSAEISINNFSILWSFRNSSGITEKTFFLSIFTDNSFRHGNLSKLGKSWSRKQHTVSRYLCKEFQNGKFETVILIHHTIFTWKVFTYCYWRKTCLTPLLSGGVGGGLPYAKKRIFSDLHRRMQYGRKLYFRGIISLSFQSPISLRSVAGVSVGLKSEPVSRVVVPCCSWAQYNN